MKRFTGLLIATMTVSPYALAQGGGLLPDLRTIVPLHLQIVNAHQRDILRFSNGIANAGAGHWRMRPRFLVSGTGTRDAIQEILAANGNLVQEAVVSQFQLAHWKRCALFGEEHKSDQCHLRLNVDKVHSLRFKPLVERQGASSLCRGTSP